MGIAGECFSRDRKGYDLLSTLSGLGLVFRSASCEQSELGFSEMLNATKDMANSP